MQSPRRPGTFWLALWFTIVVSALQAEETAAPSAPPPAKVFRAGAATSTITPPLGMPIIGGFYPVPSTYIHDDLHARCLVLDNSETRLAIVICDLLGLDRNLCDATRSLIHAQNGIPEENILIAATHTHSASSALGKDRFAYDQPLDDYQNFLVVRIADGVRCAVSNLAPAQVGWDSAQKPEYVFNRRWIMQPGSVAPNPFGGTNDQVKMNPAPASTNLVRPAGPTDPQICFVAFRTPAGKPIALLANYALHYVGGVPDGHISADYYGVFCDRVQQHLGADRQDPPFVGLLSNGTSGDINNLDFSQKVTVYPPYEKMQRVADDLAQTAIKAWQGMKFHDWAPLAGQLQLLELGVRHPTPEQLERARKILGTPENPRARTTLETIYAQRALRMNEYPPTMSFPVQALRIGDVGIGGLPNEIFCETGLAIKKGSPFALSFVIEIANGYYGYLPTPEQHKLGGYETWLGTNRLEPEASSKYRDLILDLWRELKSQP